MPDLTASQIVLLIAVLLYTVVTAVFDIRTRRIPNMLTAPMCVAGIIYQVSFFQLSGLWTALLGFATGFGILFVLWMIGTAGGGDVKLMGSLGTWLGASMTLKVLLCSLAFVTVGTAVIVVYAVISKGIRRTKSQYLKSGTAGETTSQRQKRRVMAFAAPVALGTWCMLGLHLFGNGGW